ncbi:MAG: peptidylprolyl isomerase [bacterium]
MAKEFPIVTISMRDRDEPIVLELYPDVAPNTVKNFIRLVTNHYYDGVIFHRVIRDFMIQGGAGKPTPAIKGEFTNNGFANNLKHVRGVISMARTADPDSASGQFFIMHKDSPHLDGNYAAFGKMIAGFATLDAIASARTNYQDKPVADAMMASVTADTHGIAY